LAEDNQRPFRGRQLGGGFANLVPLEPGSLEQRVHIEPVETAFERRKSFGVLDDKVEILAFGIGQSARQHQQRGGFFTGPIAQPHGSEVVEFGR